MNIKATGGEEISFLMLQLYEALIGTWPREQESASRDIWIHFLISVPLGNWTPEGDIPNWATWDMIFALLVSGQSWEQRTYREQKEKHTELKWEKLDFSLCFVFYRGIASGQVIFHLFEL